MTLSIARIAMNVCVARVMTVAMPDIGASTRPASIEAATSAPTVSLPSRIRNTPMTIISKSRDLLGAIRDGQCHRRPEVNILARPGGGSDRFLPRPLHPRFGSGCAHGFDAGQRLHQDAVPGRRLRLQAAHCAVQGKLQHQPDGDHDRQHHERDQRQGARDNEQNTDEKDREEEIRRRYDAA